MNCRALPRPPSTKPRVSWISDMLSSSRFGSCSSMAARTCLISASVLIGSPLVLDPPVGPVRTAEPGGRREPVRGMEPAAALGGAPFLEGDFLLILMRALDEIALAGTDRVSHVTS